MRDQPYRLPVGGLVDRARPLSFRFDGKGYQGYAGDTLASALLAAGLRVVGRSFKMHRPRGVFSAGAEEPNALVRVGRGAEAVPNLRATEVLLTDGLEAFSQNAWPSLHCDIGALKGAIASAWGTGFYYRPALAPRWAWHLMEPLLRRSAGLGPAPGNDAIETRTPIHQHCDLLVVGGGPSGLKAAMAGVANGQRVLLCDDQPRLGGSLLWCARSIDDLPSVQWAETCAQHLAASEDCVILNGGVCFSLGDGSLALIEQRLGPGRSQLWKVRAREIVLATGAMERPILFPGNDRPGIMLLDAARRYHKQFAVRPAWQPVVLTNNDSAYEDLAGLGVQAVLDLRPEVAPHVCAKLNDIPLMTGVQVRATEGRKGLTAIRLQDGERIPCDGLYQAGGWAPSLQLFSQAGGRLQFDEALGAHLPMGPLDSIRVVGAARGGVDLGGGQAMQRQDLSLLSNVKQPIFIDLQNDVTFQDIVSARDQGFQSIEHIKRFTTVGMGTDQGRTATANLIRLLADLQGQDPNEIGHTTYRAPVAPVALSAVIGKAAERWMAPLRKTPFHNASEHAGADFVESGLWLYPRVYALPGESLAQATKREVLNTRQNVGMVDMSSLGKFDLRGPDALTFLERVYCNGLAGLQVGRTRYALMLREDGLIFDDGTVTCLAEDHYHLTSTTARAGEVWLHLEALRQIHWPDLKVTLTDVSDLWAALAVAGPNSRSLIASLAPGLDLAQPYGGLAIGEVAGCPARVFRLSYSGELGYEVHVHADQAEAIWQALSQAGRDFGLLPYGLEALDVMRIEKGHIAVGTEIDGRTTPGDLGLGRMVSNKKDFIGRALLQRPDLQATNRRRLVGLRPLDPNASIPPGCLLAERPWRGDKQDPTGHATAVIDSPTLGGSLALALLQDGHNRHGEQLYALSPIIGESCPVEVTSPHFYDPEGRRQRD